MFLPILQKNNSSPSLMLLFFFSWCISCCCSASEREAFAEREVEGQKHLLQGALCHLKLFSTGGSSRYINRCYRSDSHQRGTICPLGALPSLLPEDSSSLASASAPVVYCLRANQKAADALQETRSLPCVSPLALLSSVVPPATRCWSFDGFSGWQLAWLLFCSPGGQAKPRQQVGLAGAGARRSQGTVSLNNPAPGARR